jgi:hypothetical protein
VEIYEYRILIFFVFNTAGICVEYKYIQNKRDEEIFGETINKDMLHTRLGLMVDVIILFISAKKKKERNLSTER